MTRSSIESLDSFPPALGCIFLANGDSNLINSNPCPSWNTHCEVSTVSRRRSGWPLTFWVLRARPQSADNRSKSTFRLMARHSTSQRPSSGLDSLITFPFQKTIVSPPTGLADQRASLIPLASP